MAAKMASNRQAGLVAPLPALTWHEDADAWRRWLTDAGLPARSVRALRESAVVPPARWSAARAWLGERLGSGVTLPVLGPQGRGKTVLAVAVACDLAKKMPVPPRVCYTTLRELALRLESALRGGPERETRWEVMQELEAAQLLILDECGKGTETESESKLVFELLDARHRAEKDTLLLSNHGPTPESGREFSESEKQGAAGLFAAWCGPSLYQRVMEGKKAAILFCDWEGMRK